MQARCNACCGRGAPCAGCCLGCAGQYCGDGSCCMFDDQPCCGLDASPETATVDNVCNKIVAAIRQGESHETLSALIEFAVKHRRALRRRGDLNRLYGGISYHDRYSGWYCCKNGTIATLLGTHRGLVDAEVLTDRWLDTGARMFVPNYFGWTLLTQAVWHIDTAYLAFVIAIAGRRRVSLNMATLCDMADTGQMRMMRTALDVAIDLGKFSHVSVLQEAGALTYTQMKTMAIYPPRSEQTSAPNRVSSDSSEAASSSDSGGPPSYDTVATRLAK
jgi:hypothetical protein